MRPHQEDPTLKERTTNNKKISSQEHHVGGKRRIGRDIDRKAAATSSKELHVSLKAEQEAFAKDRFLEGALLTGELQQTFAGQQLRAKSVDIKAHIAALQASIDVHNNPADVTSLLKAKRDLRALTPLPQPASAQPASWQVTQAKQYLP